MTINPCSLCQIEIHVTDMERSLAFYREVFGWAETPCDILNYRVLDVPAECPFGISLLLGSISNSKPTGVTLYFKTDHADQIVAKAQSFLNKTMPPARTLPGYGRVQFVEDSNGHRFGLFCASPSF